MDLRNHLNLINNHNYKGWIAIYSGPNNICIKHGDVVLVEDQPKYTYDGERHSSEVDWLNSHRVMEMPMTEQMIKENIQQNSLIKTWMTTVGTPLIQLERIYL